MTVHALPDRCWVLQWEGLPASGRGGHAHYDGEGHARVASRTRDGGLRAMHKNCGGHIIFDTGAYCTGCEDEHLSDKDWEQRDCTPVQLGAPCWVISCDCGRCDPDSLYDVDGGYECHEPSEAAAYALAWSISWRVTPDGHAYTGTCTVPSDTVLAPPPSRQPYLADLLGL